jgi:hypothetical protein
LPAVGSGLGTLSRHRRSVVRPHPLTARVLRPTVRPWSTHHQILMPRACRVSPGRDRNFPARRRMASGRPIVFCIRTRPSRPLTTSSPPPGTERFDLGLPNATYPGRQEREAPWSPPLHRLLSTASGRSCVPDQRDHCSCIRDINPSHVRGEPCGASSPSGSRAKTQNAQSYERVPSMPRAMQRGPSARLVKCVLLRPDTRAQAAGLPPDLTQP